MSNRTLYPTSRIDRWLFWSTPAIFLSNHLVRSGFILSGADFIFFPLGTLTVWSLLYFIQDLPRNQFDDYTVVIRNLEGIGKQLTELSTFLKRERERLAESEATLKKLRDEKSQLEPVVLAQKETVNAILGAYTKTTASRLWKERALGFIIGMLASLIASLVVEAVRGAMK